MMFFMMRVFIAILFFACTAYAGHISSPPPLADLPVSLQLYLKELYDHFGTIEVVTTNPDGSRVGSKGEMLQLQTGGNYYHCENVDGSTTWRCVQLTDTP